MAAVVVFVVVAVTCDGRCRYKTLGEELAAGGRIDDVQTMFAHCELVGAPCRDSPRWLLLLVFVGRLLLL